jgi:hypothetical protein
MYFPSQKLISHNSYIGLFLTILQGINPRIYPDRKRRIRLFLGGKKCGNRQVVEGKEVSPGQGGSTGAFFVPDLQTDLLLQMTVTDE